MTCNKTIFWSTLVTPKSINNEFNQPGHSIHSFHGQKFIPSTTKKTLPTTRGDERTAESQAIRLKVKRHATFFYQCDT